MGSNCAAFASEYCKIAASPLQLLHSMLQRIRPDFNMDADVLFLKFCATSQKHPIDMALE